MAHAARDRAAPGAAARLPRRGRGRRHWLVTVAAALALVTGLAACGSSGSSKGGATGASGTSAPSPGPPRQGGVMSEAVVGSQWPVLDPATSTQDVADAQYFNLIYGELFQAGPKGALLPDIATGYRYSHGDLEIDIPIRPGVTFSDGHALTASVVAWSMNRVLHQPNNFAANFLAIATPVTTSGNTVVLHLKYRESAIVEAFIGQALNWTVDPYALRSEGATAYAQHPVGAGPFVVQTNVASNKLVLVRNSRYWQKGFPRLDGLNIVNVGSDQSAYSALQAGEVQMIGGIGGITTISLVKQVQQQRRYNVVFTPAATYEFVSLNQSKPPFDNIVAREALIDATNPGQLVSALYDNLFTVVQGPTAPGELFYYGPTVPGYPRYDLAKAKQLVKQLGGLHVDLSTTSNTQYWQNEATALASQWRQAGITTSIELRSLQETLQDLSRGNWTALDSNWGIYLDPGAALPYYFSSKGGASGIHDPTLDAMINSGTATTNAAARAAIYKRIAAYMAKKDDADFLYDKTIIQIASKKVGWLPRYGPSYGEILWQDVSLAR